MWLLVVVAGVQHACMPMPPIEAGYSKDDCYFKAAHEIQKWMKIDVRVQDFNCREISRHDKQGG